MILRNYSDLSLYILNMASHMIFPFLLYNFSISRHPLTFHARTLYTFIFVVLGIISACKPGVDLCMSFTSGHPWCSAQFVPYYSNSVSKSYVCPYLDHIQTCTIAFLTVMILRSTKMKRTKILKYL